jgi:hypothetical protein
VRAETYLSVQMFSGLQSSTSTSAEGGVLDCAAGSYREGLLLHFKPTIPWRHHEQPANFKSI